MPLLPFQEYGVQFLSSRNHALLADDMGLGKTIQAIEVMNRLKAKSALIITPATVKYNWERELKEWLRRDLTVQVVKDGATIISLDSDIVIVNYDLVIRPAIHRQLITRDFAIGICDEAHRLKNPRAKRTKAILASKTALMGRCVYRYLLTGTPILNRPEELFIILRSLAPEKMGPYYSWPEYAKRYCNGHWQDGEYVTTGASNLEELRDRLKGFMLRRTKQEVLKELPARREQVIYLNDLKFPTDELVPLATERRELGIHKIKSILSHVEDVLSGVDKVVVFAYHRQVIETLKRDLAAYGPTIIYGGMSAENKQKNLFKFTETDESRVLIGQINAAGVGIDGLQRVCQHLIFAELEWSPGVMEQCIDRLRRIGQKGSVLVQYLIVPNSLEAVIEQVLAKKRRLIDRLMEQTEDTMTIEQSLDRIATALEAIANSGDTISTSGQEQTASTPIKTTAKPTKGSKKAEPAVLMVAEPETSEDFLSEAAPTPPAKATIKVTMDDVREAVERFVNSGADEKAQKIRAREIIKEAGQADRLNEVAPANFMALIEAIVEAENVDLGSDEL